MSTFGFSPGKSGSLEDQLNPQVEDGKPKITAREVLDRFEKGRSAINGDQWNYWLNHAYLMGEQWLQANTTTHILEQIAFDPDRVQATVNRMWPSSRVIISKLTSRPLQFHVPPTGADDATIRAAKTSESILKAIHREHDWEGIREDLAWSVWKGGTAAVGVYWDSESGTPLGILDGPEGLASKRKTGTGDTCEEVLSITEFVIEPGARDGEKARWWIKSIGLPPEQVQELYDLPTVPPADATSATTPFQRKLVNTSLGGISTGVDASLALTQVWTLYERPNDLCPPGQVVTVVNNKIVQNDPWPFPWKDRLNLVLVRETRIEGQWTGDTVLRAARPVQRAINQSWSSIIEHMKLAGNARLFVPQSSMDMIDQLTDLPAEVVPYPDGTSIPSWESPPTMPAWWADEPGKLRLELDDILGVHEVSRGDAPGRVDSALGLSILVEQDSTPIGRLTKEFAGAFGRLAEMVLRLYEKNVRETRTAIVRVPGQPPRAHKWSGKNLKGQVVAEVPLDAIMPRSRAAQEAFAKEALQMGLITTLPEFYKLADIPMDKDILEVLSPDVAKARRENSQMALNNIAIPVPFDDHNIHIAEHLTFMKSSEWDMLDADIQNTFRLHVQAHATLSAEELGRQFTKSQFNPLLATAADASGAPALPIEALAGAGLGVAAETLPPEGVLPPAPEAEIAGLIAAENPGIPLPIIEEGI